MSSPSELEKKCNEGTVSSEGYAECMRKSNLPVFNFNRLRITPNQAMNRAVSLILVLLFLHYIKVITLPLKFIPQMK
jgi:hypothetical protein